MMQRKQILLMSIAMSVPSSSQASVGDAKIVMNANYSSIASTDDVIGLFPKTVEEIEARAAEIQKQVAQQLTMLLNIPAEQRTFENTARALDHICEQLEVQMSTLGFMQYVSTDATIRQASQRISQQLDEFYIDSIANSVDLYQAFKSYVEGNAKRETLTSIEQYFIDQTMDSFQRNGLDLPADQLNLVKNLNKEITALSLQFSANIANGQRSFTVTKEELLGVSEDFIASLARDGDLYVVGTDYPTNAQIMENCTVESTRRKMHEAFRTRAYPENMPILAALIAKRDELARTLGYANYAEFDLADQMIKSPQAAEEFIHELAQRTSLKAQEEFARLIAELPEGISLTQDNKLAPWNIGYVKSQYKKKHGNIDEAKIAEYFPVQKTLEGLLSIYEQFMHLSFEIVPVTNLWSDDLMMLKIYSKSDAVLRGYLILDLYPRANKFSHAASFTMVHAITLADGTYLPAVDVVVANFPRGTENKPALFKHSDVTTFFHEFGHAIHTILGGTEFAAFSGTKVKTDFVELPSQMLEEWLWDVEMLKKVSGHYVTGEALPDALLEKKIELKNLSMGIFVLTQLYYAKISLSLYKDGMTKDTKKISEDLYSAFLPFVDTSEAMDDAWIASFGHLTGYGAKYYGYMYSKVFALDLFYHIKQFGLLNTEIGKKYVEEILGKGGTIDPETLMTNFLGRLPNQDAFIADLGLHTEPVQAQVLAAQPAA